MKQIKILLRLSLIVIVMSCVSVSYSKEDDTMNKGVYQNDEIDTKSFYITFTDPELAKAVNAQLGRGEITSPVYETDLLGLTTLDASNRGIVSLEGLQYATNLRVLDLSNNNLKNIGPLRNLTKLEELNLNNNNIIDISYINTSVDLIKLKLNNNPLQSVVSILDLKKLRELEVSNVKIIDSNSFALLTDIGTLTHLNVSNCGLRNINGIQNMSNLISLNASHNEIEDISPLSQIPNLEYLDLTYNRITDLSPIGYGGFKMLRDLAIENQNFTMRNSISTDGPVRITNPYKDQYGSYISNIQVSPVSNCVNDVFEWNFENPGEYTITLSLNNTLNINGNIFNYSSTINQEVYVEYMLDLEIPLSLSIEMDSQGNLNWETPIKIGNNGDKTVKVKKIEFKSKNGWLLQHFNKDYQSNMVGVKEFSLRVHGEEILENNNSLFFDDLYISPYNFVYLGIDVKMPQQVEGADKLNIADMMIYIEPV